VIEKLCTVVVPQAPGIGSLMFNEMSPRLAPVLGFNASSLPGKLPATYSFPSFIVIWLTWPLLNGGLKVEIT
jgi:hypothetical protein